MFITGAYGLRGFGLRNFKCFRETPVLELRPLTLLFGANNTGKSSLIEGILLPAHTLRSEDPGLSLRMYSTENDFGTFTDIAHRHSASSKVAFIYEMELRVDDAAPWERRAKPRKMTARVTVEFGFLPQKRETYVSSVDIVTPEHQFRISPKSRYRSSVNVEDPALTPEQLKWVSRSLNRRNFLYEMGFTRAVWNRLAREMVPEVEERVVDRARTYSGIMSALGECLSDVYYLGPLRTHPARTYLHSGERPSWVGARGQYALQVYSLLASSQAAEDIRKAAAISHDLALLGFSRDVRLVHQGDRHFELWTTHSDSGMSGNLADTGFGASQVFPVIVGLHTLPPNATMLVEQPELHLHPRAQAELGSVFARVAAARPDVRMVVETHSENLLLRIQRETLEPSAEGFGLDSLAVLITEPGLDGHTVRKMDLTQEAKFESEWPRGFWDDTYEEAVSLTNARMRRRESAS